MDYRETGCVWMIDGNGLGSHQVAEFGINGFKSLLTLLLRAWSLARVQCKGTDFECTYMALVSDKSVWPDTQQNNQIHYSTIICLSSILALKRKWS
jgi:hypothetical protein